MIGGVEIGQARPKEAEAMADESKHVFPDHIATRAHQLWEARGCPAGDGVDDWLAAEAELLRRREGAQSAVPGTRITRWFARLRPKAA